MNFDPSVEIALSLQKSSPQRDASLFVAMVLRRVSLPSAPRIPMSLPDALAAGVAALKGGRAAEAVVHLRPVYEDTQLAEAEDLRDIYARVCSLYAQACLDHGEVTEADQAVRKAVRWTRLLRDRAGLEAVRTLQDKVVARLVQDQQQAQRRIEEERMAATPLEDLITPLSDPKEIATTMVKKALAEVDYGDPTRAEHIATDALSRFEAIGDVHGQVTALIALSRACPSRALDTLVDGLDRADRAGEFNLVSTIARAAEVAGVTLPAHQLPESPE